MRRISKRKGAVALLVTGLMTIGAGFSLEGVASADPHFDETQYDLHLKEQQHNKSWADFKGEAKECRGAETPEGFPYLWHFVVPDYKANPGALPDIEAVYAYIDGVEVSGGNVVQNGKGWNLYTASGGTLIDAVGDSTATHDPAIELVLSHTCGPDQSSSSSSTTNTSSTNTSSTNTSSTNTSSTSNTTSTQTSSTSQTTVRSSFSSSTTTSESSSTETSSASVLPSSLVNTSSEAPSSQATVSGVVVTRQLPRTGFDPGLLLMLGGMLVVSGVLMLRYADDRI